MIIKGLEYWLQTVYWILQPKGAMKSLWEKEWHNQSYHSGTIVEMPQTLTEGSRKPQGQLTQTPMSPTAVTPGPPAHTVSSRMGPLRPYDKGGKAALSSGMDGSGFGYK